MQEQDLSIKQRIYRKLCTVFQKSLPDRTYIRMLYYVRLGKKCDLSCPKSFNEKLNWMKLYDRNPLYTKMADKLAVRDIVKEKLGEEYLIPLIGSWKKTADIDTGSLPEQFVLKCTHDSASVVICKDKKSFDFEEAFRKLEKSLSTNYFYPAREWVYKDIPPRIVAEEYMTDESGTELKDYKIFCFNGKPELIQVDFGRFTHHERNLYSTDWELLKETFEYPGNPEHLIERPENLEEMLSFAAKLSEGIPSVRTDFYSIRGKTYFGEITFYQEGGFGHFSSEEFENKLGELIELPEK